MTEPTAASPAAPPPRRRRRKWPLLALLLVGIFAAVFFGYPPLRDEWRLSAAIAEADRLDPGWRWEELQSRRRVVPDEENSALRVLKAYALMPDPWPAGKVWNETVSLSFYDVGLNLPAQLDTVRLAAIREQIANVPIKALEEARAVSELPGGRFEIDADPSPFKKGSPVFQKTGKVIELLHLHIYLLDQEGDIDGAVLSCRAILNISRAWANEPDVLPFLIGVSSRSRAIWAIRRSLAQGEASGPALDKLQQLLTLDEPEPLLLTAARGERASRNQYLNAIRNGGLSDPSLEKNIAMVRQWRKKDESSLKTGWEVADNWLDRWREESVGSIKIAQAQLLEYFNAWVEVAKLPLHMQHERGKSLDVDLESKPLLVRTLTFGGFDRSANGYVRSRALQRSAIAAVAAERYRLANGRWPDSLQRLVPQYLAEVPHDPFDNHELRYVRKPDGIVIYSIGDDGKDDGGDVLQSREKRPDDIGFRLWDVAKRRQAPMPPPKKDE